MPTTTTPQIRFRTIDGVRTRPRTASGARKVRCCVGDTAGVVLRAYARSLACACALTLAGIASPGVSRRSSEAAGLARHGSSMKAREGGNGEDQACPVGSPAA